MKYYRARRGAGLPSLLYSSLGRGSRCCEICREVAWEAMLIVSGGDCQKISQEERTMDF